MREHKIRVWNGEELLGPFDLTQNPKYWADKLQDGEIMQYTGLKDKNGREIYEGDIIALEVIKGVKIKVPVKFENGSFNIHEIPGGYGFSDTAYPLGKLFLRDFGIEAIGNIYENPELLEGK